MSEEEMDHISEQVAVRVFKLLIKKQQEWDQQFTSEVQGMFNEAQPLEELLLVEMDRLMTLLSSYEESEQYDKAANIHNKIKILQEKLNEL
jgi:endonuclease III|tara:strand:- start:290 stop:562 length:273 start_codon:yes stop_codon:yes gene_type:complete